MPSPTTHAIPLAEINDGFALMQEGGSIRSVALYD